MAIPFIVFFILLLRLNKRILAKNYKVYNPLSIYLYIWIAVLLLHSIYFDIVEYTLYTYFLVSFGGVFLSIGFWLTAPRKMSAVLRHFNIGDLENNYGYNLDGIYGLLKFLTIMEAIRVIYISLVIFRMAGSLDVFIHDNTYVRNLYLARGGGIGSLVEFITNTFGLFGNVVVAIYTANKGRKSLLFSFIWIAFETLFALVTMSKMSLILYIVAYLVALINNVGEIKIQKRITRKLVPFFVVGICAFLMLVGHQRNYEYYGNSLSQVVFSKAILYVTGPVEAIGKYMSLYPSDLQLGKSTFIFITKILSRIGLMNEEVARHGEFISIAHGTTNVYTWFKSFYIDYSYFGFITIPFFLGIIAGFFYNPDEKNIFLDVCNTWVCAGFFISFYSFIWHQTIYIYIFVFAWIIHRTMARKIYVIDDIEA